MTPLIGGVYQGEREKPTVQRTNWMDNLSNSYSYLCAYAPYASISFRTRSIVASILLMEFLLVRANQPAFAGFLEIRRNFA